MDRLQHPLFARAFARAVAGMDRRGAAEHRRRIVAGLQGSVVEIGAGAGSSFPLYPPAVTHVLALEPDDYLRSVAEKAAASASVPVTVVAGAAEHIPAPSGSVDAVVASLVLCSVGDQATTLAEIRRVLKPGGTLAYYEHVRSAHAVLARAEDVLTPVWGTVHGRLPSQPGHPCRHHRGGIHSPGQPTLRFCRCAVQPAHGPHPGNRHQSRGA